MADWVACKRHRVVSLAASGFSQRMQNEHTGLPVRLPAVTSATFARAVWLAVGGRRWLKLPVGSGLKPVAGALFLRCATQPVQAV